MKWIAVAMGAVVLGVAAAIIFVDIVRPEKMTAANEGNARAPSSVQSTNSADKGVPEEESAVVRMFRVAAEQGDADAQYMLGYMYAHGDGIPEDDAAAVRWFRLAAEQGVTEAHTALGLSYTRGEGVPKDPVTGYAWLSIAAEQGETSAKMGKGLLDRMLTESQIAEARIRSREYKMHYVDPFQ